MPTEYGDGSPVVTYLWDIASRGVSDQDHIDTRNAEFNILDSAHNSGKQGGLLYGETLIPDIWDIADCNLTPEQVKTLQSAGGAVVLMHYPDLTFSATLYGTEQEARDAFASL